MEPHWHEHLKTAKDKILSSGYQLQEVADYSETNYNEQISRLSEHCDKMVRTINAILKEEKINV